MSLKKNISLCIKRFKKNVKLLLLLLPVQTFALINCNVKIQDSIIDNKVLLGGEISAEISFSDSLKYLKVYYGKASFYSKSLEGTKTSNDEIFRHNKLTAASNKFKLGTWLRVTNLSNDKSIIVRVNDRMHPKMAARGRIVDLSRLGAQKLDFIKKGVVKVKVQVVPKNTKE